jgi:hypothetical protein
MSFLTQTNSQVNLNELKNYYNKSNLLLRFDAIHGCVCVLNAATTSFDTFTYVLSLSFFCFSFKFVLELKMLKEQERCFNRCIFECMLCFCVFVSCAFFQMVSNVSLILKSALKLWPKMYKFT